MLVPNRHGSSESYRYGFNGMEKDDEIKGYGSSYDFGARMYDPRLGRWFTPDSKSALQPNWSTYKAFFDNPNLFIDPDGNTEWQVTTVINHKTGKTVMIFEIIDAEKLAKKIINVRDYYYKDWDYQYSDIIHSSTINIYEDGTQTTENHKTEYAERYVRDADWDFVPEIPSINLGSDSDIKVKDGHVFTTEWGKDGIAKQNKSAIRNAKDNDMTALIAVTDIIRGGKLPKGLDAVNNTLDNTSGIVQNIFDKNGIAGEVQLKEGKIEIKYEEEKMIKVEYQSVEPGYWILQKPNGNVIPNSKKRDTLVPESKEVKVKSELDKKYEKERVKAVEKGKKIQKGG